MSHTPPVRPTAAAAAPEATVLATFGSARQRKQRASATAPSTSNTGSYVPKFKTGAKGKQPRPTAADPAAALPLNTSLEQAFGLLQTNSVTKTARMNALEVVEQSLLQAQPLAYHGDRIVYLADQLLASPFVEWCLFPFDWFSFFSHFFPVLSSPVRRTPSLLNWQSVY